MKFGILILLMNTFSMATDWEAQYVDVCTRDAFCSRLRQSDGTWNKPKPEIIATFKVQQIQDEVKSASAKYGIDPVALAGSIFAENSLNVGVLHEAKDYLAEKFNITSIGGKQRSFGFGAINMSAAMSAENHMAKIENRQPRTHDQLIQENLTPTGSIRIAAMIIREAQDVYKEHGFDISKDPGLLATLYNLGDYERRAGEAEKNNRPPRINYFGLFVDKYASDIKTYAKIDSPAKINVAVVAPAITTSVSSRVTSSVKAKNQGPLVQVDYTKESTPLTTAPSFCDSRSDISPEYSKPSGVLEGKSSYTTVSRAIGCKSKVWELVSTPNGNSGWIEEDQLEKISGKRYQEASPCKALPEAKSCEQNIQKMAGDSVVETDEKNGLIYLNPVAASKQNGITFARMDKTCNFKVPETTEPRRGNKAKWFGSINAQNIKPLSEGEIEATRVSNEDFIKFVDNAKANMSKTLKIPINKLDGPENPYSPLIAYLNRTQEVAISCVHSMQTPVTSCPVTSWDSVKKEYNKVALVKNPSLLDISSIVQKTADAEAVAVGSSAYYANSSVSPEELANTSPEEIQISVNDCAENLEKLRKMAGYVKPPPTAQSAAPVINSYNSAGAYGILGGYSSGSQGVSPDDVFSAVKNATPDQIRSHSVEFINFTKDCHARLNTIQKRNEKSIKFSCQVGAAYQQFRSLASVSRDVIDKYYQENPLALLETFSDSANLVDASTVKDILENKNSKNEVSDVDAEKPDLAAGYCPNRTVEYIENLIKENPCIKKVYAPTQYLSDKLSGDEVNSVYRVFDKPDRYAVEIGVPQCK